MLVTEVVKTVANILKLSSTHFGSNIRHQQSLKDDLNEIKSITVNKNVSISFYQNKCFEVIRNLAE